MKNFKIYTLFPQSFLKGDEPTGNLGIGIIGKSFNRLWSMEIVDLKSYGDGRVDDRPAGGGAGMVIKPDIIYEALKEEKRKIYFTSPRGKVFNQETAQQILQEECVFISGRYEAMDQRVIDYFSMEEIS